MDAVDFLLKRGFSPKEIVEVVNGGILPLCKCGKPVHPMPTGNDKCLNCTKKLRSR